MNTKDWLGVIGQYGMAIIMALLGVDAWVHRRTDAEGSAKARLDVLERTFDKIAAKSSEEANKWQIFIGESRVAIAIAQQQLLAIEHRIQAIEQRHRRKDANE